MDLPEIKGIAENALKAFNECKDMIEGVKAEQNTLKGKLDAFDQKKFDNIVADVSKAVEAAEALKGKQAALEQQQKQLETAFNRPGAATSEDKSKEVAEKRKKLFNQFAKSRSANKEYFDEWLDTKLTDEQERKALSVGSDPDGGYTVMPESGGIIIGKIFESSPIRQLASVITIGSDAWEVLTDNDEASSGWVGETGNRSETDTPTLGKIVIPVHEIYAEPRATQKIIDDSVVDIEGWLAGKVGDIFARKEAEAFVVGNGVNKPRGLMTYSAGTDVTLGQIQQVNSQDATDYTYAGLVSLQSSLKEEYQSNATFLTKRASIANLMLIVDGNGRPIFNPMFDKNVGLETSVMGRPLRFANDVADVGSNAAPTRSLTARASACCAIHTPPNLTSSSTRPSVWAAASSTSKRSRFRKSHPNQQLRGASAPHISLKGLNLWHNAMDRMTRRLCGRECLARSTPTPPPLPTSSTRWVTTR